MNRVITVKGTGSVCVKPDLIVLDIWMETRHAEYSKCMKQAAKEMESLRKRIAEKEFEEDALKTVAYEIKAEYRRVKDSRGDSHDLFDTWHYRHSLKLEFPLDLERLSEVIYAIRDSDTPPKFNVRFSVGDDSEIRNDLLKNATENARERARLLCDAGNVKLGDLLTIDYASDEYSLFSDTEYKDDRDIFFGKPSSMHIDPEEIRIRDTVTFVWEIV